MQKKIVDQLNDKNINLDVTAYRNKIAKNVYKPKDIGFKLG